MRETIRKGAVSFSTTPVVRSVELPNGQRMVIVRQDAFQTALKAAKQASRKVNGSRDAQVERKPISA